MARGKKKESALTPEEKLAQALLPVEEQPYKVPGNWVWTHWGNCGEFIAGNGFKNEYQGFQGLPIPFYKVGSLKYSDSSGYLYDASNTIDEEIRGKLKATIIPVNSVIFAKIGEAIRLNRRSLNAVPCCIDNNLMAFIANGSCLFSYAFYWSKGTELYDFTNATTVPAIRKSDLEMIPFPLPPLAEQQRIVDRVEYLFAKLDEAKEKAQSVLDSFETRKAAILHKAFTGELTAKWKTEHSAPAFSKMEKFGEITSEVRLGLVKGKVDQAYDKQYPYLKMNNITVDGRVDIEDLVCVDASEDEVKMYSLHEGDFLFNTRNSFELVGKNTVWNSEKSGVVLFNNNIMRVRFSSEINPRYVSFFFNSSEGKAQLDKCKKNTTNIAAIY